MYLLDEGGNWISAPQELYDRIINKRVRENGEWTTLNQTVEKRFCPGDLQAEAKKKAELLTRIITTGICDYMLKTQTKAKGRGNQVIWKRTSNEEFHLYDAILDFLMREIQNPGSTCGKLFADEENIFRIDLVPFRGSRSK